MLAGAVGKTKPASGTPRVWVCQALGFSHPPETCPQLQGVWVLPCAAQAGLSPLAMCRGARCTCPDPWGVCR